MKKILLLLLFPLQLFATTYYFDFTGGNDANAGTSTGAAWKTVTKFNSFMASASNGDIFLFKRGETFTGVTMTVTHASITIGAYGSGVKPIISGFATMSWTAVGGNIYQASVTSATPVMMVSVGGVLTPMGRFPNANAANAGYMTYTGTSGTSYTVAALSGTPNWTGASWVYRGQRWIINRTPITAQSGSVLTTTNAGSYGGENGYGGFIQNDVRTLDQNGEWYHNTSANTIRMYYSTTPPTTKVATITNLVAPTGVANVTISNVDFQGCNGDAIAMSGNTGWNISNCKISFAGMNGIAHTNVTNSTFTADTIININNTAIGLKSGSCSGNTMSYLVVDNTGMNPGMLQNGDGQTVGVRCDGTNITAEYCRITNSGYVALNGAGSGMTIRYNLVDGFCSVKDDGAGIYVRNFALGSGNVITGNIVLNGVGAPYGTDDAGYVPAMGIYLDEGSNNYTVSNNSVYQVAMHGMFLNEGHDVSFTGNNVFTGTSKALYPRGLVIKNAFNPGGSPYSFTTNNITLQDNIITVGNNVSTPFGNQNFTMEISTPARIAATFPVMDDNVYARPLQEPTTMYVGSNISLATFKTTYSKELASTISPITIGNINLARFEYNYTNATVIRSLGAKYMDMLGVEHNGAVSIPPYSSVTLLYVGPSSGNISPVSNAGPNQTITLPTSSITMAGSGSDADGTITSKVWSKISGPAGETITTPSSYTSTVTGLSAGDYVFQLLVTDNNSATGTDVMNVHVDAAPPANIPPVVDAGPNQTIQLPTTSITFAGNATDADGTIASHTWTQTSGPSCTITTPSSYTSTVTAMNTVGTYIFQLSATDDLSATSTDVMQVIVQAANNIPPVINSISATPSAIQLPTNSVTLSVSATDSDGSIASYSWSKKSGGSGTITNPTSASTTVTGLATGDYIFQVVVTDNSGGVAIGNVGVTVNPLPSVCSKPAETKNNITVSQKDCKAVQGSVKKKYSYRVSGTSLQGTLYTGTNNIGISSLPNGSYTLQVKQYGFWYSWRYATNFTIKRQ